MTTRLEKPIRRELEILGVIYVVELSKAGVMFRPKGTRRRFVAPIGGVLRLAFSHHELAKQLRRESTGNDARSRRVQ